VKPDGTNQHTATHSLSVHQPFVSTLANGRCRLVLAVEPIHCARCVFAIESALTPHPAITHARVNMGTKRLTIEWRGEAALADSFAHAVESLGYHLKAVRENAPDASEDESRFLLKCLAVSGFAMGNIMLLSVSLWTTDSSTMSVATRDLLHWLSALIALPTLAYAGRPFFHSAYSVLRKGRTNMDVPISLALILASIMSIFETLNHGEYAYFDSTVMLIFFLLIGRWLDARARGKAHEAAAALLQMMQGVATRILEDGTYETIAIEKLREGMRVYVAMGEKIPTDAIILSGSSELDCSMITGETLPQTATAGDTVFGGTLNLAAPLTLEILKASEDSLLASIIRLMEQAEQGRARYVRLADRAAKLFTPIVHALALATFLGWFFIGHAPWQDALLYAVAVLLITCPCALGLAVPAVQVLATSWLMRRGVLVKSGDALERLASVTSVVFDKTGTLTLGTPTLLGAYREDEYFSLAASLAAQSRHPLAQALLTSYHGSLLPLDAVEESAGMGMRAFWQGREIRLGRRSWCGAADAADDTYQELWLSLDGHAAQRFTFIDQLRPDARETIAKLAEAKLPLILLSGDRAAVTHTVGQELGIHTIQSELLPADKFQIVAQMQASGQRILMVGDGLNDAPALMAATVSISPASALDITQNSADIVFQGERLLPVYACWKMACFSTRLVKENFALAIAYNVIAVPMAICGYITPLIAAIAMSASSVVVVLNAFRINLQKAE